MHKEAIHELGEKVGTVEEVETDEDRECIRAFARGSNLYRHYSPAKENHISQTGRRNKRF